MLDLAGNLLKNRIWKISTVKKLIVERDLLKISTYKYPKFSDLEKKKEEEAAKQKEVKEEEPDEDVPLSDFPDLIEIAVQGKRGYVSLN